MRILALAASLLAVACAGPRAAEIQTAAVAGDSMKCVIKVGPAGNYQLDRQTLTLVCVMQTLEAVRAKHKLQIKIEADPKAPFEQISALLVRLIQGGFLPKGTVA